MKKSCKPHGHRWTQITSQELEAHLFGDPGDNWDVWGCKRCGRLSVNTHRVGSENRWEPLRQWPTESDIQRMERADLRSYWRHMRIFMNVEDEEGIDNEI